MYISTIRQELTKLMIYETACPYKNINVCAASFSSMQIDTYTKEQYCNNENFDSCPIFLAKALRKF
jgi:hypothetical protein